uniref:CAP-Gly domain-containing protein n=1 Tax=Echinostoma caproni TaxID=27848 RepID=A0A183AVV7_9TREM
LTVNLDDSPAAPCKNALHSPTLHVKPASIGTRFFDRSSDSAFSSQYDTSPRSSSGSSNPSELASLSTTQVPIIIGDRVYVGPSRLTGTVAYMGPTHFAAGDMVGTYVNTKCYLAIVFKVVETRQKDRSGRLCICKERGWHLICTSINHSH